MTYRESDPPIETDRSVLVLGIGGKCIGVERASGTLRWSTELDSGGGKEVFLAFRFGVLVASAGGAAIYRLDYASGKTLWRATTSGGGRATILVEPDLIIVAKDGYVDAFDHDGRELWRQPLRGQGLHRVALAFPGNVAQADGEGRNS